MLHFEPDYLFNILNGENDPSDPDPSPPPAKLPYGSTVQDDVAEIKDIVRVINEKIDTVSGGNSPMTVASPRTPGSVRAPRRYQTGYHADRLDRHGMAGEA